MATATAEAPTVHSVIFEITEGRRSGEVYIRNVILTPGYTDEEDIPKILGRIMDEPTAAIRVMRADYLHPLGE